MTVLSGFAERLRAERHRKGLNQEDFAALGDVKKNSQVLYETAKTPPTVEYLLKLAEHGVDVSYVLTGSAEAIASNADLAAMLSGAIGHLPAAEFATGAITPFARGFAQSPRAASDLDLVEVREIDLTYGLGAAYADDPIESRILHFPRVWLQSITRSPPSELTFARGRGDSMQPTIQDGDIVLIDRSIRTVREQDAIWALTVGEFAMIKRLRMKGENVTILSDNDRVSDDQVFHEEINIVGRVIFIGRRL